MADFLLELFSEEIPARMQSQAVEYLQSSLQKSLGVKSSKAFVTPCRLAVIINDLPVTQPDVNIELKGPKVDAPEAAINGFLKKNNLTREQLEKRNGVYFSVTHQKGKATADILKIIIEETLANFPWPKSMRWGSGSAVWVRPLHSILCVFDGNIVPVEFAGIKAGNITYGHRFLAPQKVTVNSPEEYEDILEKKFVIADRNKRKDEIFRQAELVAAELGLQVKKDNFLLEEVTGLVEYPQVLVGKIDDKFMDLPPEVLTSVMRSHQKYFALQNADGTLSPYFLITSNIKTEDSGKAIISGNERVLRARFADARFFWDTDRKKPLSDWAEGLKNVTYQAKLGTMADRVARIIGYAIQLCEHVVVNDSIADPVYVHRAAELCKADLVTGMVGEFPELQGVMGRYYAMQQGEKQEVADAIRDHYKPAGAGDVVPTDPVSVCVALADKLDTLIEMFRIGEKPTGSKDPFALRRAALGIIRILLENNLRLRLFSIVFGDVLSFLHDRLKVQLRDSGIRHDVINAVMRQDDDDLKGVHVRANILQNFISTDNGENLLAAYKRATNILTIEEKKDKVKYSFGGFDPSYLVEPEEKELYKILQEFGEYFERKSMEIICLANMNYRGSLENKDEKYGELMAGLASLRQPLDLFFDKIMVNCEDKTLRIARLSLLSRVRDIMDRVADFSQIEG